MYQPIVWRDPNRLAIAIRWLLVANAVVLGLTIFVALYLRAVINEYSDGGRTDDELLGALGLYLAAAAAGGALQIATGVVTIVWQWRLAKNTELMNRPGATFGPGWAIAGWLIPCVNFVVPYLQLRELWKGADWRHPAGDPEWKTAPVGPVLPLWLVAWIGNSVLAFYAQFANPTQGQDIDDAADQFSSVVSFVVPGYLVAIAAAVLFMIVVQQLTERHDHAVALAASGRLGRAD
jgi:hypothetical protein